MEVMWGKYTLPSVERKRQAAIRAQFRATTLQQQREGGARRFVPVKSHLYSCRAALLALPYYRQRMMQAEMQAEMLQAAFRTPSELAQMERDCAACRL